MKHLKHLGYAVALVSVAFVLRELVHSGLWSGASLDPLALVGVGLAGGIAYGVSEVLLSVAWWQLVGKGGFASSHRINARAQIAKYLPGNVFHFVGRHALGASAGIAHGTLLVAVAGEIVSLVAAASLVTGALLMSLGDAPFPETARLVLPIGGALATCGAALLIALPRTRLAARIPVLKDACQLSGLALGRTTLLHLAFFLASGLVFFGILIALAPADVHVSAAETIGIGAAAWLAGFLVPGVSAGVGVREATLILLLSPMIGHDLAIGGALAYRIATVSGDAIYWASSYAFGNERERTYKPSSH